MSKNYSTKKSRQLRSNVKWAFSGKAVEILLVLCPDCRHYVMYQGSEKVRCRNCVQKVGGTHAKVQTLCRISYKCQRCHNTTDLARLCDVGFYCCLHCFFKPSFNSLCELIQKPVDERINGFPVFPIGSEWKNQPPSIVKSVNHRDDFPYSNTDYVFYPSKAIGPFPFRNFLSGKCSSLWAYVWRCHHCGCFNEFEYVSKSKCQCGKFTDTSHYFSISPTEDSRKVEVYLDLECDKCHKRSISNLWLKSETLRCILCGYVPVVGSHLKIFRSLSTAIDDSSVHTFGSNEWRWKVEQTFVSKNLAQPRALDPRVDEQ